MDVFNRNVHDGLEIVRSIDKEIGDFIYKYLSDNMIKEFWYFKVYTEIYSHRECSNVRIINFHFTHYSPPWSVEEKNFKSSPFNITQFDILSLDKFLEIIKMDLVPDIIGLIISILLKNIKSYPNNIMTGYSCYNKVYILENHLFNLLENINNTCNKY